MEIKKKKRRKLLYVLLPAAALLLLFAAAFFIIGGKSAKIINSFSFTAVNASTVGDGIYVGECDANLIYVKVQVIIENGQFAEIKLLEHQNGMGAPAEQTLEAMIASQTTEVDTISGATLSSKVIRKAVENALLGLNS